ncbi:hypothetical protein DPMN_134293 [Dreissena polymorpha]|uniref:C1q domain-containing protein n=1 Tax=Dreissena polymorpha TaxID=45954 RepID=A0A9D4JES2_DREPO|nr:hypothetical protein DPMN_134293 [Dreissena polymorpha]
MRFSFCTLLEQLNVGAKYSREITRPVAFTAIKINSQTGIGVNQNIVFDSVILNDGGGFNAYHGLFTAPVTGYYLFSTTILHTPHSQELHAGIMHKGNLIAMIHGFVNVFEQGTQTVVLKVRTGEQVWIGNRDYTNQYVYGDYYSSFSGFLLHQLE